jgi:hypothetical protein
MRPLIASLLLSSCTMGPTHYAKDGDKTSFTTAGISILTKSDYDKSNVSNGQFTANHEVFKKNETAVPVMKMAQELGGAVLDELVPMTEAINGN